MTFVDRVKDLLEKNIVREKDFDSKNVSFVDDLLDKSAKEIVDGLLKRTNNDSKKAFDILNNVTDGLKNKIEIEKAKLQLLKDSFLALGFANELKEEKSNKTIKKAASNKKEKDSVSKNPVDIFDALIENNLPPAFSDNSHFHKIMCFFNNDYTKPYQLYGVEKTADSKTLFHFVHYYVDPKQISTQKQSGIDRKAEFCTKTPEELHQYIEECEKNVGSLGELYLAFGKHYYNSVDETLTKIDDIELLKNKFIDYSSERLMNDISSRVSEKYKDKNIYKSDVETVLDVIKSLEIPEDPDESPNKVLTIKIEDIEDYLPNFSKDTIETIIKALENEHFIKRFQNGIKLGWANKVSGKAKEIYKQYDDKQNTSVSLDNLVAKFDIPANYKKYRTETLGKQYWNQLIRTNLYNPTTFMARRFMPYSKKIRQKIEPEEKNAFTKETYANYVILFYKEFKDQLKELYYSIKNGFKNDQFNAFLKNAGFKEENKQNINIFDEIWNFYKMCIYDAKTNKYNYAYESEPDIFETITTDPFINNNFSVFLRDPLLSTSITRKNTLLHLDDVEVEQIKVMSADGKTPVKVILKAGKKEDGTDNVIAEIDGTMYQHIKDQIVNDAVTMKDHFTITNNLIQNWLDNMYPLLEKYNKKIQKKSDELNNTDDEKEIKSLNQEIDKYNKERDRCAMLFLSYLNAYKVSGEQLFQNIFGSITDETGQNLSFINQETENLFYNYLCDQKAQDQITQILSDESKTKEEKDIILKAGIINAFQDMIDNNPTIVYQGNNFQLVKLPNENGRYCTLRWLDQDDNGEPSISHNAGISILMQNLSYFISDVPLMRNNLDALDKQMSVPGKKKYIPPLYFQVPGDVRELRTHNASDRKLKNDINEVIKVTKTRHLRGVVTCIDEYLLKGTAAHIPLNKLISAQPIPLTDSIESLYLIENLEYDSSFVNFTPTGQVLPGMVDEYQYNQVNKEATIDQIKSHIRIRFSVFSRTVTSNAINRQENGSKLRGSEKNHTVLLPLSIVEQILQKHVVMNDDTIEKFTILNTTTKGYFDEVVKKLQWLQANNFFDSEAECTNRDLAKLRKNLPQSVIAEMKAYLTKLENVNQFVEKTNSFLGGETKALFAPDDYKSIHRGYVFEPNIKKHPNQVNAKYGMFSKK